MRGHMVGDDVRLFSLAATPLLTVAVAEQAAGTHREFLVTGSLRCNPHSGKVEQANQMDQRAGPVLRRSIMRCLCTGIQAPAG